MDERHLTSWQKCLICEVARLHNNGITAGVIGYHLGASGNVVALDAKRLPEYIERRPCPGQTACYAYRLTALGLTVRNTCLTEGI